MTPKGLRAADAPRIRELVGGDMKLLLRVGALLEAKLAFSPLALESLAAEEDGRRLLLDRGLAAADGAALERLAAAHSCSGAGLALAEADEGWRVVCLADEIGNPLAMPAAEPEPAGAPAGALPTLVASLAPALRAPVEGLMQARADSERAAALEQLRYATPPLPVVCELMPMLLADGADIVRERAIALCVSSGAHVAVVDLVRALHRRDDAAVLRAGEVVARLPAVQQDVAVSAALAAAARGAASPGLVGLCAQLAPHLAAHRGMERLLELLLATRFSLLDLVRALQGIDRPRVEAVLRRNLGLGVEQDATLIILLADPRSPVSGDPDLLGRGVDLLLSPDEEPRERMALAAALRRLGPAAAADALALAAARLPRAHDTSVYWLLAELCRDGAVGPSAATALAAALRRLLHEAPGYHLIAMLEQQLPALLPASEGERRSLVAPMLETVARYRDERTRDLVASCLASLGVLAVPPLWEVVEEHPHAHVRSLAAEQFPVLLAAEPAERLQAAVERLLAGLARAVQGDERGWLVTAAARLAVLPPLADGRAAAAVDAATAGLGAHAIEALGHLAAGPACPEARRSEVIDRLLADLVVDLPDAEGDGATSVVDAATGETTWRMDDRLGAHTENAPRLLSALLRIGQSPHLPQEERRRLVNRLCAHWRKVSSWKTIWGPGNILDLARSLGALAEHAACPEALRHSVAEALAPRIGQLTVARALGRIFAACQGARLAQLAGRCAGELVRLAAEGHFADDEVPELTEVAVDYLAVPELGRDAAAVRRRLVHLLSSQHQHCTSRARAKLRYLRGELPPDLAERVEWA